MVKKIPMRTCIGCGQSKEKKNLVRIVHATDGQILIDRTGRVGGRGAYLCDDFSCLEKALKKNAFSRAFGVALPRETAEMLRTEFGAGRPSDEGGGPESAG